MTPDFVISIGQKTTLLILYLTMPVLLAAFAVKALITSGFTKLLINFFLREGYIDHIIDMEL